MIILAAIMLQLFIILLFNPSWRISEALGGGIGGTPFSPATIVKADGTIDMEKEGEIYWIKACAYLALFLILQWLFLWPRGSWRLMLSPGGPLPRRSLFAAGFIGMLLAVGAIATLMELLNWWINLTTDSGLNSPQHFGWVWALMAAMWVFWTWIFWIYTRGQDRYSSLARILRWLIAGTILELVISGPAHAIIVTSRGDECYCERGTWTGIAFGCTAAFWLFGPGAAILMMREVRRREQLL
jgi:hypothetical protein